ncbi:hypothetical protein [Paractinoplanes atraurantiacus]|uniref:Transposase, YhgA-like n=1 Tax=Paractinoplanes atraurantiacus TaxID=1036182 RepID=A0A285K4V6_9ACTN|nr:hypothetical protein [Actinoplanes atraurantiacus]SNY66371.1 hypothetical protein SAMN05421748_13020 [Actinoplanes atraurantiacus]
MTETVSSGVAAPRASPARDFDGLYKALFDFYPREALQLLCGVKLDGVTVVLEGPTEIPRQRSRQCDRVYQLQYDDGAPSEVLHVEVQVKRTEDFEERMVSYWAGLAQKYRRSSHRIQQVVLWPLGGGYPGRFIRDQARLDYLPVDVPRDLDPGSLLATPLAPLALWSPNAPDDVVEQVADRIADVGTLEEKLVLVELGTLVGGSLAAQVLEALGRRGMNDVLEQTEPGREIARRNREQGLERGHVDGMRAALRARYGDFADLDDLARRLAERDHDGNIARIVAGASLAELRS